MVGTIKPIPKKLLVHEIIYTEKYNNDGWNSATKPDPITIKNVLVQPNYYFNRRVNNNADMETGEHLLIIDRVNSSNFFEMKRGSTVEFEGNEWKVSKVTPVYTFSTTPHHYEVELI